MNNIIQWHFVPHSVRGSLNGIIHNIASHHTTYQHITSHHTTPHHTPPHHTTPHPTTPHHTTPYHVTPHPTTPYHVTPRHTTPHHTPPHHITPIHITIHPTEIMLIYLLVICYWLFNEAPHKFRVDELGFMKVHWRLTNLKSLVLDKFFKAIDNVDMFFVVEVAYIACDTRKNLPRLFWGKLESCGNFGQNHWQCIQKIKYLFLLFFLKFNLF